MKFFFYITFILFLTSLNKSEAITNPNQYIDSLININSSLKDRDTNKTLNNIRIAFRYQLINPKKGMPFAENAIKLSKIQKYDRGLSNAYSSYASLYYAINNLEIAEEYIKLAYNTSLNTKNQNLISDNTTNLALILSEQKKYKEAKKYFLKSIELDKKSNNHHGLISTYERLGMLYINMNLLQKALHYLHLSDSLIHKFNFPNTSLSKSNILLQKSQIYIKQENYNKAKPLLYKSKIINDSLNLSKFNIEVFKLLNIIYDKENKIDSAYYFYKKLYELKESNYSEKSSNQMILANKNQIINTLKDEEQLNKFTIILILSFSFLIIILTFYFYKKFKNEKQLKSQINSKNDELKSTITKLNELKNELEASNYDKDKFISILAHDMKNPLFGLMIQTYNLHKLNNKIENPEINEKLKSLYLNSKELNHLLDSLIEWYKNQSGRIKNIPEIFYLGEEILSIIETYKSEIDFKNLKIINNIKENEIIKIDKNLTISIIRNLFNNAVKYSKDYGEIQLNCNCTEDKFIIKVKDNGNGIDQKIINDISNNRKKLNSISEKDNLKGEGLGLMICLEFTELLGGNLQIDSQNTNGTEFIVTLPKLNIN